MLRLSSATGRTEVIVFDSLWRTAFHPHLRTTSSPLEDAPLDSYSHLDLAVRACSPAAMRYRLAPSHQRTRTPLTMTTQRLPTHTQSSLAPQTRTAAHRPPPTSRLDEETAPTPPSLHQQRQTATRRTTHALLPAHSLPPCSPTPVATRRQRCAALRGRRGLKGFKIKIHRHKYSLF